MASVRAEVRIAYAHLLAHRHRGISELPSDVPLAAIEAVLHDHCLHPVRLGHRPIAPAICDQLVDIEQSSLATRRPQLAREPTQLGITSKIAHHRSLATKVETVTARSAIDFLARALGSAGTSCG
jgi:hypothetical protein